MTKPSAPLDLGTCSPRDLSSWLLSSSRFDGDEMAVTTFLLEAVSSLPNAQAISDQLVRDTSSSSSPPTEPRETVSLKREKAEGPSDSHGDLGSRMSPSLLIGDGPLCVSMSNPRGKFDVEWHENGLAFAETKTPSNRIAVARGTVANVIVFPKPEDLLRAKHSSSSQRGSGGVKGSSAAKAMALIVFRRDANCTFRNKRIQQVCFQLPMLPATGRVKGTGSGDNGVSSMEYEDDEAFVQCLTQRLGLTDPSQVVRVLRDSTFQSHNEAGTSTTTSGMPFVNCYHGVNDGVVFPLSKGLLFVKPPMFVPVESIHSIAVGSRNSSGGRYIDLNVMVRAVGSEGNKEGTTSVEFTSIHKDEAPGLNRYIQSLVRGAGRDNSSDRNSLPPSDDVEADGATGDEDGTQSKPVDATSPKSRNGRPPARRAGVAASATFQNQPISSRSDDDDDEDEDGDFVATEKLNESENSDDDDDDDDDFGGNSEHESNDEGGDESSAECVEATEDESTESESEESANDANDMGGEKSSKKARLS